METTDSFEMLTPTYRLGGNTSQKTNLYRTNLTCDKAWNTITKCI